MHSNPGVTLLKVLLIAAIVFFVGFNAWAIHRLETRAGQSDQSDSANVSTDANRGNPSAGPAIQTLADGTVIARGVIVLPSGVVIVPEGLGARVYSADGKLVADTTHPDSNGNSGNSGNGAGTDGDWAGTDGD